MYITFRLQRGIGEVAEEMCFGEDIYLKFACLDTREGERCSINSEEQLELQFPKSFENVDRTQGINHSHFHYCIYRALIFIKIKISHVVVYLETCELIKKCEKHRNNAKRAVQSKDPSECKMKVLLMCKTRKLSNQKKPSI